MVMFWPGLERSGANNTLAFSAITRYREAVLLQHQSSSQMENEVDPENYNNTLLVHHNP